MFDDFFFPYERAKLWTRDMVILSLSNFFLYISLYIMLPVLPLWMVQHWYCSYAEAGGAVAVFGLTMFLPGPCNSYIIDTFKRKSVCVITLALLAGVSLLYPYVATVGLVALLRMVQGALFSVVTMTTGSTLVWKIRHGIGAGVGGLYISLLEFYLCGLCVCGIWNRCIATDSTASYPFPCSFMSSSFFFRPFFIAPYTSSRNKYVVGLFYIRSHYCTYL